MKTIKEVVLISILTMLVACGGQVNQDAPQVENPQIENPQGLIDMGYHHSLEAGTIKEGWTFLPDSDELVKVTYEDLDGIAVFEADIILGQVYSDSEVNAENELSTQANIQKSIDTRWPNGVVPYAINSNLTTPRPNYTTLINNAIAQLEASTNIDMVLRTTETDYIDFVGGSGCSSAIGRQGGKQVITLTTASGFVCPVGTIMHEILHALGVSHEQSRPDRDKYITVLTQNIQTGKAHNFNKKTSTRNLGPYDYGSIMHYNSTFLGINGATTMETIPVGIPIGQNTALSDLDIAWINTMYPAEQNLWSQDTDDAHGTVKGASEAGDQFAHTLATGDFDGDGYEDIAIGNPYEDIGSTVNAGYVNVLYGTDTGLSALGTKEQDLYQGGGNGRAMDFGNLSGTPEANDYFGYALAVGDFNGDGYDDLAVGAPGETNGTGMVFTILGSNNGLTPTNKNNWFLDGVTDYGYALATGDFNKDGYDELAIGIPGSSSNAGIVDVLKGTPNGSGLTVTGFQRLDQNLTSNSSKEANDRFGAAITTGDYNGDGYDDILIGAYGEAIGTKQNAGAASVFYGSGNGIDTSSGFTYNQDIIGGGEVTAKDDNFGQVLTSGDYNKDGYTDVAISAPNERLGRKAQTGVVHVMYGGNGSGLQTSSAEVWHQNSPKLLYSNKTGNNFGSSLATGDFNKDGVDDLAIGIMNKKVSDQASAGATTLLMGSATGITGEFSVWLTQNAPGSTENGATENYNFGYSLAAGDFNKDGRSDIAIGVPNQKVDSQLAAGAMNVFYNYARTIK